MINTLLVITMILAGIICVSSILLMNPKWGLWMWIWWWSAWWDDYGSKKSIEWALKKSAIISAIIFFSLALFVPYL